MDNNQPDLPPENIPASNNSSNQPPFDAPDQEERLLRFYQMLPRVELLLLLIFTFFTLGTYTFYWLHTRTQLLNRLLPEHKIASQMIVLGVVAAVVYLLGIYQFMAGLSAVVDMNNMETLTASPEYARLSNYVLFYNMVMLAWAFLFCMRLNQLNASQRNDALYANYGYLFVIHLILVATVYMQYKVNQLKDSQRLGLM